jgi:hypothetical protein
MDVIAALIRSWCHPAPLVYKAIPLYVELW